MRNPGRTPPFRGPDGAIVQGSIAETAYLRIGGLDQWVMMRGASAANPPLIHLHGGPGLSEWPFFRWYNAPLEHAFTVVSWDQRGTSRSFDPATPRATMTVGQFVSDLDELVDAVRARLGHSRVIIFGHSWGSAFGALYAARHPDKVAAYVGSGQVGDWARGEALSYAFALAEARRQRNRRAERDLIAIGPPPHTAERVWTQRIWLMRLQGELSPRMLWRNARVLLFQPESSLLGLRDFSRGLQFSMDAMWSEVTGLDLLKQAPVLRMPALFLIGRHDHYVPPETSVAYFEALHAPAKQFVWFEHSGHEPFVDEPDKFNAEMIRRVRPVWDAAAAHAGETTEPVPVSAA